MSSAPAPPLEIFTETPELESHFNDLVSRGNRTFFVVPWHAYNCAQMLLHLDSFSSPYLPCPVFLRLLSLSGCLPMLLLLIYAEWLQRKKALDELANFLREEEKVHTWSRQVECTKGFTQCRIHVSFACAWHISTDNWSSCRRQLW